MSVILPSDGVWPSLAAEAGASSLGLFVWDELWPVVGWLIGDWAFWLPPEPPLPEFRTRNTITATTTTAAPAPADTAYLRLVSVLLVVDEYWGALADGAAAGIGL